MVYIPKWTEEKKISSDWVNEQQNYTWNLSGGEAKLGATLIVWVQLTRTFLFPCHKLDKIGFPKLPFAFQAAMFPREASPSNASLKLLFVVLVQNVAGKEQVLYPPVWS